MEENAPVQAPRIRVCVGVLAVDGRVLIGKRPAHVPLGGYWEFPGGKLEPGETPESALQREMREELGIDVLILRPLLHGHKTSDSHVQLLPFLCRPAQPERVTQIHAHVNDELRWVRPSELPHYRFPPANADLLNEIQSLQLDAEP